MKFGFQEIREEVDDKEFEKEILLTQNTTDRTSTELKSVKRRKPITRKGKITPKDDACTPQRPLPTVRHIESFIKGPAPELPEPTAQDPLVKSYKEEVEAARGRIYPRISAFQDLQTIISPSNSPPPTDSDVTDEQSHQ